ncbi:MAG: hypothetical protein ACU0A2_05305 [Cognatishimia sp.]|uniref:hypothetical protein n=1 Tax=Cognatishimia sp. TaxID=2211648 RepID=UPI0040583619
MDQQSKSSERQKDAKLRTQFIGGSEMIERVLKRQAQMTQSRVGPAFSTWSSAIRATTIFGTGNSRVSAALGAGVISNGLHERRQPANIRRQSLGTNFPTDLHVVAKSGFWQRRFVLLPSAPNFSFPISSPSSEATTAGNCPFFKHIKSLKTETKNAPHEVFTGVSQQLANDFKGDVTSKDHKL